MKATRLLFACLLLGILPAASGCLWAPRSQLTAYQTLNQNLARQCRAQLVQINTLEGHRREVEDRLIRAEEELALMEEQVGSDRKQLVNYQRERAELHEQFKGLANRPARVPPAVVKQLTKLSNRHPSLHFDPATGISKLDTDILFDSGQTEIKPGAERVLADLVSVLKSPEARDLKVMVVGHTDNRRVADRRAREKHPNNFHLSTARAHAVADLMQRQGFAHQRLGVAGFGSHQPIAPNVSPKDCQKNRRVEIFVLGRDVPVVGWTDSIPSVY